MKISRGGGLSPVPNKHHSGYFMVRMGSKLKLPDVHSKFEPDALL